MNIMNHSPMVVRKNIQTNMTRFSFGPATDVDFVSFVGELLLLAFAGVFSQLIIGGILLGP